VRASIQYQNNRKVRRNRVGNVLESSIVAIHELDSLRSARILNVIAISVFGAMLIHLVDALMEDLEETTVMFPR
jgi:hypothetical protein